jgi:hypothetical protein
MEIWCGGAALSPLAHKDSSTFLSRKVRGVLLKQIQVKLCILKLVLKQKYCKILYRSGT